MKKLLTFGLFLVLAVGFNPAFADKSNNYTMHDKSDNLVLVDDSEARGHENMRGHKNRDVKDRGVKDRVLDILEGLDLSLTEDDITYLLNGVVNTRDAHFLTYPEIEFLLRDLINTNHVGAGRSLDNDLVDRSQQTRGMTSGRHTAQD